MTDGLPLIITASLAILLAAFYGMFMARAPISAARSAFKTAPVLVLALAVLLGAGPLLLIAALIASALGDYALSRPGQRAFLAGLMAFALAHLVYITLILGYNWGLFAPWQYIALAALGVLWVGTIILLWPRSGALRLPIAMYALFICAMGAAAVLGAVNLPGVVVLAGAALFIAADITLAVEKFLLSPAQRQATGLVRLVWVLYFSAQLLLAVGLGDLV